MKIFSHIIILCSMCLVNVLHAQITGVEIEASAYTGTSYEAKKSVTLKSPFSFKATEGTSFYAKIVPLDIGFVQKNNVVTEISRIPGVYTEAQFYSLYPHEKETRISYMDGLGRAIQRVDQYASPDFEDIVQHLTYNNRGMQEKQYLPYVTAGDGNFQTDAVVDQAAFYSAGGTVAEDSAPFSLTRYDDSPLRIVVEQGAVGADWQPGTGHTIQLSDRVNTVTDQVLRWSEGGPGIPYDEEELVVREFTGENGEITVLFRDKSGKVILKKSQLEETIIENSTSQYTEYLETYYVYDDFGNIIYQVPPKAVAKIKNGAVWNPAFVEEWVFRYTYNEDRQIIVKKIPGSGDIYLVYDRKGRLVMSQDAKNRVQGKWFFTKYDLGGRPVLQGLYTFSELYPGTGLDPREQLQKKYDELDYNSPGTYFFEEKQVSTDHGYSNRVFPTSGTEVLVVNYFDDYDFTGDGVADYSYADPGLTGAATAAYHHIQGALTGSKKRVLGNSTWITNVLFYDEYGRVIQRRSNNHLHNTASLDDVQALVYDGFSRAPKLVKQVKNSSPSSSITVNNRLVYDHRDRVKEIYQSNNGSAEQQLARYEYNTLGQLIDKSLHKNANGSFLQSLDYRYNIRGWLTRINNSDLSAEANDNGVADLFGMEMVYNTAVAGLDNTLRYDGSLSAVKWKTNDMGSSSNNPVYERGYKFNYDRMGQLKDALYAANNGTDWTAEVGGYDEKNIRYDHNGNILALQRYQLESGGTSPTLIDDLTYTYGTGSGNQLTGVEDVSGSAEGFKGNNVTGDDYLYDENGNLVTDKNKGDGTTAMSIMYNEIGKTSRVDLPGGRYIQYTYAASGERLRKEVYNSSGLLKTLDYVEGFVYENAALSYFGMAEGRVRNAGGTLKYEYFIKDHQGNVRVSFEEYNGEARIVQENHYYPFGLTMKGAIMRTAVPTSPNKNLYNGGSELQDDFGDDPNLYSTFFREYDPVLGRMNGVDPLADRFASWSPYNYSFNTPVNLNDPTGAVPRSWSEWQEKYREDALSDPFYVDCGGKCDEGLTDEEKNWNKSPDDGGGDQNEPVAFHVQGEEVLVSRSVDFTFMGWGAGDLYIDDEVDPYDVAQNDEALAEFNEGIKNTGTLVGVGETVTNSLKTKGKAVKHLRVTNKALSTIGKALSLIGVISETQMVRNGTMGIGEFAYNTTGTVSATVISGMIGGPYGAVAGVIIGVGFDISKEAGSIIYDGVSEGLAEFKNQTINSFVNFR